jgi:hypothetical protein
LMPVAAERFVPPRDRWLCVEQRLQLNTPGLDNAARWLPAPKGGFMLTLRLYAPKTTPPAAWPPGQGSWVPPGLRRAH